MSVLPFPSFLDDVKEKGLKRAVFEIVDESVERLTAGMNVQDVREALRGEDPSRRPNPRLQPHADGFWLHMRPSYYSRDVTGIYPTFRLGWLSMYFVFFETITGLLLMLWYTPSPEIAYGNMLNILSNVPLGQLIRDMHRLGAEFMVAVVCLHLLRTWITGSYKKPRQFTWFTGLILLIVTGFLSFSGYLLPWDQLSLWAVTIGASMTEATPVIGEQFNLLFRGAPELGANGLLRFYLLHVLLLPVLLFIFAGVHYYKVIIHGLSLPPEDENIGEDTAKRVPLDKRVYFIPEVLTNELMWVGVTTFIITVLCIWFYHAPLENHADPQVTPLGTTAPWYFLWIQGALKLGDKFFWGIAFPTIALGGLAIIPYLDVTPSRRYAHRRWMLTFAMLLVSVTTILSYMGLAKFAVQTSAEIEILHEMVFEPAHNHMGAIRPVPFDQLVSGAYTTRQFDEDMSPTQAVEEFNAMMLETTTQLNANGDVVETTWYDLMVDKLRADHLTENQIPTEPNIFRVVPEDAPELLHALEELHHMIEENSTELPNAFGAIILTRNQDSLVRVDILISWDGVVIENGDVLLEDGEPVLDTRLVDIEQVDENGAPILDEDGNPVVETIEIIRRGLDARHIFLHENAGYFD